MMAATMAMASEISMPYSAVSTALPMLVLDRSACALLAATIWAINSRPE